jgi:hypothetical protein
VDLIPTKENTMHFRLLIALLTTLCFSLSTTAPPVAAANECWVYTFDATTFTWGGTFDQQGVLVVFPEPVITSTGSSTLANEWELWFQIGNPYTSPGPGAIYFATNSAITNTTDLAATQLQLADITWNDDGYFVITPRLYESQQLVNMFTAYGGVTAIPYTVTAGTMGIAFSDDYETFYAQVDFLGHSFLTPAQRADVPYQAEMTGSFLTTSTDCVTPGR